MDLRGISDEVKLFQKRDECKLLISLASEEGLAVKDSMLKLTRKLDFQLHVMDSLDELGVKARDGTLSTPCDGFYTMGALVIVYYLLIAGFYSVFHCCTLVFPAVGPHGLGWLRGYLSFTLYHP